MAASSVPQRQLSGDPGLRSCRFQTRLGSGSKIQQMAASGSEQSNCGCSTQSNNAMAKDERHAERVVVRGAPAWPRNLVLVFTRLHSKAGSAKAVQSPHNFQSGRCVSIVFQQTLLRLLLPLQPSEQLSNCRLPECAQNDGEAACLGRGR